MMSQTKYIQRICFLMLLLLGLGAGNCLAQEDITPPDLILTDVRPDWLYISEDTNYIRREGDVWSSPYWGRRILNTLQDGDNYYLLEQSRAQSPNGGEDGFLLSKVDKSTGEAIWVLHKNSLAGNQFREEYYDNSLQWDATNEDRLVVHGMAANDTITFEQGVFAYPARPTEIYINTMDGTLDELKYGAPSPPEYNSWVLSGNRTILQDGNLYHATRSDDVVDGYSQSYISIYETDDLCTIDTSSFAVITNKAKSSLLENVRTQTSIVNHEDNFLYLFNIDRDVVENEIRNVSLSKVDLSEMPMLREVYEYDLSSIFPTVLNSFDTGTFGEVIDEELVVYSGHFVPSQDDYYSLLVWLDKDGNELLVLDDVPAIYHLNAIGRIGEDFYLTGQSELKETVVYKVSAGSSELEVVGKVAFENSNEIESIFLSNVSFDNDENLIFRYTVDVRNSLNNRTTINYTYKFDKSQFGILSSSTDVAIDIGASLSPNPAYDKISLKMNEVENASVRIMDQLGRAHIAIPQASTDRWDLDVSNLQAGMYHAEIFMHDLQVAKTIKFIVTR